MFRCGGYNCMMFIKDDMYFAQQNNNRNYNNHKPTQAFLQQQMTFQIPYLTSKT